MSWHPSTRSACSGMWVHPPRRRRKQDRSAMEAQLLVGDVIRTAAARTPANIAVSLRDRHISFAAPNQESNALASSLLAQGVRPGARVGRGAETAIAAGQTRRGS